MSALRRLLPLLAALALSACDETRLANDLTATGPVCEADLTGLWHPRVDRGETVDYWIAIDRDCAMRVAALDDADGRPSRWQRIALQPNVLRLDGTLFLTLSDLDFHDLADGVEHAAAEAAEWHPGDAGGFHVFRLRVHRQRLDLFGIDHREVARRIIEGRLRGEVHKVGDSLQNRLLGDTDTLRETVAGSRLFVRRDPLQLVRGDPEALPEAARAVIAPLPGETP